MAKAASIAYYGAMNFLTNDKEMQTRDWLIDLAVVFVAFAFGSLQLMLSSSSIIITDEMFRQLLGIINTSPPPLAYFGMALTTFPLILRRIFPWPVFIFVTLTYLILQGVYQGYSFVIVGPVIALFTIAYERGRDEAVAAAIGAGLGVLFFVAPSQSPGMSMFLSLMNISYVAVAALAGYALRTRHDYMQAIEQRAVAAEKSREEEAARRVEEERVHIAREIHDITAHSLSAVSIQAAAAERLMEKDPEAAKEAIKTVRATSKGALEEIRSMIGVLRQKDASAETAPTSGTERMDDLVVYLKNAGVEVVYQDAGYDRKSVPSFVDIALYGIAREAVTNIVRHAHAHKAFITLWLQGGYARLAVEDDGGGSSEIVNDTEGPTQEGHGIQGMKERAYLLGGSVEAADRTEGGFKVQVSIPFVPLAETGKHL